MNLYLQKLRGAVKSLTIWLNSVAALAVASWSEIQDALPQIQQYVSPGFYKWAALAFVAANIAVRFRTKHALENK